MPSNPFTPNFGQIPRVLAGRDLLISEIDYAFENAPGDPNLTSILVGARGTGKTALLSQLSHNAQERGWIAVNVPCVAGMLEEIAQGVANKSAHLIEQVSFAHVTGINVGQLLGIEWEHEDTVYPTWYTRMAGMLDKLGELGIGLLITVDEVRPSLDEMILLASYYQIFVRENRKVSLLMAGLPSEVSLLLNDRSVSFLRRASQYHIGRLQDDDIAEALQKTAETSGRVFEDDALEHAIDASDGFPFMMQLIGYRSWQSAHSDSISVADVRVALDKASQDMKTRVLNSSLNDLSEGDLAYLAAMLEDEGDSSTGAIASRIGRSAGYASQYRRRLIEQGLIEPVSRGKVRFSLPLLKEYLPEYLGLDS